MVGPILLKLSQGALETKGEAPGNSVVVIGEGVEGQTLAPEVFQTPGVLGVPPDGFRGLYFPAGGSSRYGVVVGVHGYSLGISVEAGETVVYSTTSAGVVRALLRLKTDGTIELNGNTKTFVTHSELSTALASFVAALNVALGTKVDGGGTPGALTLDISSATTATVKTGG